MGAREVDRRSKSDVCDVGRENGFRIDDLSTNGVADGRTESSDRVGTGLGWKVA